MCDLPWPVRLPVSETVCEIEIVPIWLLGLHLLFLVCNKFCTSCSQETSDQLSNCVLFIMKFFSSVLTCLLLNLFQSNPCKHPILFLRDVAFHHLRALVEFMYAGEVNVAQAQLSAFLRTAESLQIRGLTESPQRHKQVHMKVSCVL